MVLQCKTIIKKLNKCLVTRPRKVLTGNNNLVPVNQKLKEIYKLK